MLSLQSDLDWEYSRSQPDQVIGDSVLFGFCKALQWSVLCAPFTFRCQLTQMFPLAV